MTFTSGYRGLKFLRLACALACTLAWLIGCHSAYAIEETRPSELVSFDQFIDQTTGDEVQEKDLLAQTAYRGKRVYKSIFRWIDRQGYYSDFIKRFRQWCDANGGRYVRNQGLDADCFEGKSDVRWLGAYSVQIVSTEKHAGNMTAGYATFYFFRQQEMEMARMNQLERTEQAQSLAVQRQIEDYNEQLATREQARRNLPTVKTIGQKICRTVEGSAQYAGYLIDGRRARPQYLLTAFTEGAFNEKIQLRVAAIRQKQGAGFSNVDRLLLDGDVVLQNNSVIWDDPLLWHPCDRGH